MDRERIVLLYQSVEQRFGINASFFPITAGKLVEYIQQLSRGRRRILLAMFSHKEAYCLVHRIC
jgi:hypothetical protein